MRRLVWLLSLLTLTACDVRIPGPSEAEWGNITFWQLSAVERTFTMCTNDPVFMAGFPDPTSVEGTVIAYRVADDGQSATEVRCTSTNPDDCAPAEPARRFTVSEHTLTAEDAPVSAPVVGLDCSRFSQTVVQLVDEGDEASFQQSTRWTFSGTATACDALDEVFVRLGSNGMGLRSCEVRISARGEHLGGGG